MKIKYLGQKSVLHGTAIKLCESRAPIVPRLQEYVLKKLKGVINEFVHKVTVFERI